MAIYTIEYWETYRGLYRVKAEDEKSAKEKLRDMIYHDAYPGPDECCDSGMIVLSTQLEDHDGGVQTDN